MIWQLLQSGSDEIRLNLKFTDFSVADVVIGRTMMSANHKWQVHFFPLISWQHLRRNSATLRRKWNDTYCVCVLNATPIPNIFQIFKINGIAPFASDASLVTLRRINEAVSASVIFLFDALYISV